ncbi:hypothetical protein GJ496_009422 [Pomphorhynchus laevis]|nr:hypothetical protein GJ496_009422 [Pomphorhynchus laevis]
MTIWRSGDPLSIQSGSPIAGHVERITEAEVCCALKLMMTRKATCPDDIVVDLWKCMQWSSVTWLEISSTLLLVNRVLEDCQRSSTIPIWDIKLISHITLI